MTLTRGEMNLQLLEEKTNTLTAIRDIRWYGERHSIIIQGRIIKLTATEYQLLFPLRLGTPVTYAELALAVYGCPLDEKVRLMMDKHVDRMRAKLRGMGLYIYCVLNYGYVLLPEIW
jgi:DNA-binding response OmpR family regulator